MKRISYENNLTFIKICNESNIAIKINRLPTNFCKVIILSFITSKAILDVTKKDRIIYHAASTMLAVKIK